MRYIEIASADRIHVFSEEQELLDLASKAPIAQDELDERGEELTRLMVVRGLLIQFAKDGRVFYRPNSAKDIWRGRDDD